MGPLDPTLLSFCTHHPKNCAAFRLKLPGPFCNLVFYFSVLVALFLSLWTWRAFWILSGSSLYRIYHCALLPRRCCRLWAALGYTPVSILHSRRSSFRQDGSSRLVSNMGSKSSSCTFIWCAGEPEWQRGKVSFNSSYSCSMQKFLTSKALQLLGGFASLSFIFHCASTQNLFGKGLTFQ